MIFILLFGPFALIWYSIVGLVIITILMIWMVWRMCVWLVAGAVLLFGLVASGIGALRRR